MRRAILTVAFILAASAAWAEDHDCRIKGVRISVTHENLDGQVGHRVSLHYVAPDGHDLSPLKCPDQAAPTVGTDAGTLIQQDALAYVYWLADPGPGVWLFSAATYQRKPLGPETDPWRFIYSEKRVRFN